MGSCISKCRPKSMRLKPNYIGEDFSHVHDKLVISQAPVSPSPHLTNKPVSPSPSAASSASFSSFLGATTSTGSGFSISSSLSTSSPSSSSVSISKDRSFSNEFLWSCAKENPHIIGRNLIRGKVHPQILEAPSRGRPVDLPLKQAYIPEKHGRPTPKKRAQACSPTLVRQKSFRKEPDTVSSSGHLPNRTLKTPSPSRGLHADQCFRESMTSRTLRSPSPSRRFNGDQSFRDSFTCTTTEIHGKSSVVSKTRLINPSSLILRKESVRSPSANVDSKDRNILLKRNREVFSLQMGTRIDENAVEEEKQGKDVEAMIVEDFNNPLIALDCFIFL